MKLVAITGKARAGKDTLAQAFTREGFKRIAFADALKQVTALIANEPSHLYYDDVEKEAFCPALGMTRRQALQKLGTEGIRSVFGADVWVNRVLREWVAGGRSPIVITDCRFDNEAALVREAAGIVIQVVRPQHGGSLQGEAALHASERGVRDELVDIEITNNGSVGDLHAEARKILAAYGALRCCERDTDRDGNCDRHPALPYGFPKAADGCCHKTVVVRCSDCSFVSGGQKVSDRDERETTTSESLRNMEFDARSWPYPEGEAK